MELCLPSNGLLSDEQHQWIKKIVTSDGSPWRSSYEALIESDWVLFKAFLFLPSCDIGLLKLILELARAHLAIYHPLCPTDVDEKQIRREIRTLLNPTSSFQLAAEDTKLVTQILRLKKCFMLLFEDEASHLGSYTWARMLIADRQSAEAFAVYLLAASTFPNSRSGYSASDSKLEPLVDKMVLWHPDACAVHYLRFSAVYEASKRWGNAMRLQERALELTKMRLDDCHTVTTCLAATYYKVGRWGDARRLQLELLSHLETTLGETHLDTLFVAHELALTLSRLGRWEDAEILHERVCKGRTQTLGEFHPGTMTAMQSLASSYSGQLRWEEATELHERVLQMRKDVFGVMHPDTLASMHSLAAQKQEKGELTWEIEQSGLQVLKLRRQILGDTHLDTSLSMFTLAVVYPRQGKLESAIELAAGALEIQRKNLGRDHYVTMETMVSLSSWYSERGRLSDAANLLAEILQSRRAIYGDDHPKTFASMGTLAQAYWKKGLPGRAESLHLELLEARKRVLGEDAPTYLATLLELAARYLDQCRWREALVLYKTALRIKKQDMELNCNDQEIIQIVRVHRTGLSV